MRTYVAIRRTIVRDGVKHLPRPKITQDILFIGEQEKCQAVIDNAALLPMNRSTPEIEVDLCITIYRNQKSHNSAELRRGNGKRFKK